MKLEIDQDVDLHIKFGPAELKRTSRTRVEVSFGEAAKSDTDMPAQPVDELARLEALSPEWAAIEMSAVKRKVTS